MTNTYADGPVRRVAGEMSGGEILDSERTSYSSEGPSLFWLAFRKMMLTILTFGFYRFWMTTHLRRHYWSAIRVKGDPFEYTGRGVEKLLGFLAALIILALYLGTINLGLAFLGLFSANDMTELQIVLQLSLVAALPLMYFATYRARRYVLARTRWRGIRFGMDQAAWGYTWRAMLLVLLTAVTLGLAYPYQHFRLQKYKIDRTWFGSLRFHQDGSWKTLLAYWIWIYLVIAIIAAAFVAIALDPENTTAITIGIALAIFGYLAIFLISIRYQVAAFRYLWNNRTLGDVRFRNDIDTGEVIGVYIGGSLAIGICSAIVSSLFLGLLALISFTIFGEGAISQILDFNALDQSQTQQAGYWVGLAGAAVGYLSVIAFAFIFAQIFITRPILRRKAEGMQIFNISALAESQQREHDEAAEAGGFADALGVDVGAGF